MENMGIMDYMANGIKMKLLASVRDCGLDRSCEIDHLAEGAKANAQKIFGKILAEE